MKIIADTHTHTLMSGHAASTAMEHIMVAKQKGLRFLAITDHTGIMPGSPNEVYFSTLCNSLPEEYDGVYLLRGCEANIIDANGTLDLPEWILKRLDLVIASKFDYEKVIPLFAKNGKIVEINASSFKNRPSCKENCMQIAKLCAKHGVPLAVSSDAHFAGNVGEVGMAVELLSANGIPEDAILNADLKRFAEKLTEITGRSFDL